MEKAVADVYPQGRQKRTAERTYACQRFYFDNIERQKRLIKDNMNVGRRPGRISGGF